VSRRLLAVLEGALVVALVLGVSGFTRSDTLIELSVDGQVTDVETRAETVADLLREQDVVVSDRDVVEPAAATPLADVAAVTVRHARQVQIVIDGKPTQIWTTELTVDAALDQFGVRIDDAEVSVSRTERLSLTGTRIGVHLPDRVTVLHDQRRTTVVTTAKTVSALLGEAGVRLGPDDRVNVATSRPVQTGMEIVVTRVDTRTVRRGFVIDHAVVRRADPSRYEGVEKVVQQGRDGRGVIVTRVVRHDGVTVRQRQLDRRVARQPVREIVVYGTKQRPFAAPATGAEGLNWGALAACESGGNPRAVNPAGYYGLYQFALSTWYSVGGSGNPIDASPDEQTYRAQVLYERSGAGQWPVCGPLLFS
jgi:resuscitation-promoting factor RpfB